jgi:hypothetical protein
MFTESSNPTMAKNASDVAAVMNATAKASRNGSHSAPPITPATEPVSA